MCKPPILVLFTLWEKVGEKGVWSIMIGKHAHIVNILRQKKMKGKKMKKRNYALETPQLLLFIIFLLASFILIPIPNYYAIKEENICLYRNINIIRNITIFTSSVLILILNWLIKKDKKKSKLQD